MSTTPTASANSTGNSLLNRGTQTLNSLQEVKAQTEGSAKVTKPDITKQVRDLDTKIKSLLGGGYTPSTYTNNINGHQGKATVEILNKNYKQLMEMAKDPNLTEAKGAELKGVIQDIRNLGASLEGSGWYRSNTNPDLQQGSKISDGLTRVAKALEKELHAAPLRRAMARHEASNLVLAGDSALKVSNVVMTTQDFKSVLKTLVPDPKLNQQIDAATSWGDLLKIAQQQLEKLPTRSAREVLQKNIDDINQAVNTQVDQSQAPNQIQVPKTLSSEEVDRRTAIQIQVPSTLSTQAVEDRTKRAVN